MIKIDSNYVMLGVMVIVKVKNLQFGNPQLATFVCDIISDKMHNSLLSDTGHLRTLKSVDA